VPTTIAALTHGTGRILALPANLGHIVAAMLVGSSKKMGAAAKIDQTLRVVLPIYGDAHRDDCAG
jgi:hypothetical protein